jgi:hypothetical protein
MINDDRYCIVTRVNSRFRGKTSTSSFRLGDRMCAERPMTPSDAQRLMPLIRLVLCFLARQLIKSQTQALDVCPLLRRPYQALDPRAGASALTSAARMGQLMTATERWREPLSNPLARAFGATAPSACPA